MVALRGVEKTFRARALVQNRGFALRDIDLEVHRGEVVGLLGESGSGKSTLANIVTLLTEFTGGCYLFKGRDVRGLSRTERLAFKSDVQIVFQDAYGSLNGRARIRHIVGEGLAIHKPHLDAATRAERVRALMREVGLGPDGLDRYPHEFSGGQRQRIAIARAMAVEPGLLVCDEPLSSLDVSIQAQVLMLFARLIREQALTMIFITHDINVARMLCDRVYVMFEGRIIEGGPAGDVLQHPTHEYTADLIRAVY